MISSDDDLDKYKQTELVSLQEFKKSRGEINQVFKNERTQKLSFTHLSNDFLIH